MTMMIWGQCLLFSSKTSARKEILCDGGPRHCNLWATVSEMQKETETPASSRVLGQLWWAGTNIFQNDQRLICSKKIISSLSLPLSLSLSLSRFFFVDIARLWWRGKSRQLITNLSVFFFSNRKHPEMSKKHLHSNPSVFLRKTSLSRLCRN